MQKGASVMHIQKMGLAGECLFMQGYLTTKILNCPSKPTIRSGLLYDICSNLLMCEEAVMLGNEVYKNSVNLLKS
jgi:hypothetical protein